MLFRKHCLIFIVLSLLSYNALANPQTGEIDYPALGIQFTVPQGWLGQETEAGFVMGSHTEAGLLLVSTHEEKSLDALKQQASQVIRDGSVQLQKSGQFVNLNKNAIGVEFSGYADGQAAKAFIAGVLNPHGLGVTVMALTSTAAYTQRHQQLVNEVVNSLQFSKPIKPPIVDEWKQTLKGAKLTYMDSYYSSGPSYGGYSTGGGYSSKVEIVLCQNGAFADSRNSSLSVDTGGAFGNTADSGQGNGSWTVVGNHRGGASLQLNYRDGSQAVYELDYREKKTYLNNTRYFRTYDSGC